MRINESITCGWGNGEELGMTAVVLVDVASDSFLTSMDYLYTEGKVAMEMLSYKHKLGALFWILLCNAEYNDFCSLMYVYRLFMIVTSSHSS